MFLLTSSINWHLICCPALPLCYCWCIFAAAVDDDGGGDVAAAADDVGNSLTPADVVGNIDKKYCASTAPHGNHCMNRTHYVSNREKSLDVDNNSSSDMETEDTAQHHSTRTISCCNSDTYHLKGMRSYSNPWFNCREKRQHMFENHVNRIDEAQKNKLSFFLVSRCYLHYHREA